MLKRSTALLNSAMLALSACQSSTPSQAPASGAAATAAPSSSDAGGSSAEPSSGEASLLTMTRNGGIFPVFHPVRATDNNYALLYLIFDPLVKLASL